VARWGVNHIGGYNAFDGDVVVVVVTCIGGCAACLEDINPRQCREGARRDALSTCFLPPPPEPLPGRVGISHLLRGRVAFLFTKTQADTLDSIVADFVALSAS
jgi:hypothetical protein